jgi:hypothetical protein
MQTETTSSEKQSNYYTSKTDKEECSDKSSETNEEKCFTQYSLNTNFEEIRKMLEKDSSLRQHNNKLAENGHFAPLWFKLLADSKDLSTPEKSKEFSNNIMVLWISAVLHCCLFYNLTCDEVQTQYAYDVFKTVCLENFEDFIKSSFVFGGESYKSIVEHAQEWFSTKEHVVFPLSAWVGQLEAKRINYGYFSSSKNFTSFMLTDNVQEKYEWLQNSDENLVKHQHEQGKKVISILIQLFQNLGNWQSLFNADSAFFDTACSELKKDALIPYGKALNQVANEITFLHKKIEKLTLENTKLKQAQDQRTGKSTSQSFSNNDDIE